MAWIYGLTVVLSLLGISSTNPESHKSRSLTVLRGRSAFLHPDDLSLDPVPDGELCKVKVINNDPSSQQIGRLEPEVFDCDFHPYLVKYTHYGSPLADTDEIRLEVYNFRRNGVVKGRHRLRVNIIQGPYEVVLNDPTLRPLEVKEFKGYSNIIDSNVLRFRYNYYHGAACTVSFSESAHHWPLAGRVVGPDSDEPLTEFTYDCREFLFAGLRYKHERPPTPDTDYVPLEVKVNDPAQGIDTMREQYYLPIKISGAFPNTQPKVTITGSNIIKVEEFSLSPINPDIVIAEDKETASNMLVFHIVSPDDEDHGYFVHLDEFTQPIYAFTQSDFVKNKIAYQPPSVRYQREKVVKFSLCVRDTENVGSEEFSMHFAIQPTNTDEPQVLLNSGLAVVEGHHVIVTPHNLKLLDKGDLELTEIHIKSGMRHGRLEVRGQLSTMFTPEDLEKGDVVYLHDDSDVRDDRIVFRITNGRETIRAKFPITVFSVDDSAPALINNLGFQVDEGGEVSITTDYLSSHDKDSNDDKVVYTIKTPPQFGEILLKYQPLVQGLKVTEFSQYELVHGYVYYHHFAGQLLSDSFEIRLVDDHEPPNKSSKFSVEVTIYPRQYIPPNQVAGTSCKLQSDETEVKFLTRDMLWYENTKDSSDDVTYVITSMPYFLTTTITIDAGRVFRSHNNSQPIKDAKVVPVKQFTQEDIRQKRIAYMPPLEDVGPISRHAEFIFAVIDRQGNKLLDQIFQITIKPVNNQVPHMTLYPMQVREGGTTTLTSREIMAYDPDTDQSELVFVVEDEPKYGLLLRSEIRMVRGEQFAQHDLARGVVKYVHDGTEVTEDRFGLSVFDGTHKFSKSMTVLIELVGNQPPRAIPNLKKSVKVTEGGEVVLTTTNLAATDNDTDDDELTFVTLKSPRHGVVRMNGRPATQFTQAELRHGNIKYVHTDGEIGVQTQRDSASFIVVDDKKKTRSGTPTVKAPVLDLNVTILPVDNTKPELILGGPLFVNGGQKAILSFEVISAQDLDTPPEEIGFIIASPPQWGIIQNDNSRSHSGSGSEKRDVGKAVTSFKLADLKDGSIHYVSTSAPSDQLPEEDFFSVFVTDGNQNSAASNIDVIIVADSKHLPIFQVDNLQVEEGSHRVFDVHLGEGISPEDKELLKVSVARQPRHGLLSLVMDSPDQGGSVELPLQDITMLDMGRNLHLKYSHDGSETLEDHFSLQLTDGTYVAKKSTVVSIIPINDQKPEIEQLGVLSVVFRSSATLSKSIIQAFDEDNENDDIIFYVTEGPKYGKLQKRVPEVSNDVNANDTEHGSKRYKWVKVSRGENFTQEDVNKEHVRYVHNRYGDVSKPATDSFSFVVTDGLNELSEKTFEIKIIKGNGEIVIVNNGLVMKEEEALAIRTENLHADDGINDARDITFVVTSPPTQGVLGFVGESTDPLISISRFSQHDLDEGRVTYTYSGGSVFSEDSFAFTVINKQNLSGSGEFYIAIEEGDHSPPSLDMNVPLTVVQGETAHITAANLHVSDGDTSPINLTYILIEPPQHGSILNDGVANNLFTQHDINLGKVQYKSEGSGEMGIDYFLFTITDNHHQEFLINGTREKRPAFFNILIQPMSKRPPELITNHPPTQMVMVLKGRYGFILTDENLKAEHPLSESYDIIYTVKDKPAFGHLEHLGTRRPIKKRFSQRDLDDGRVAYVLEENSYASNDSFTFRVHDHNRNTLDDQRFTMHWAVVEFDKSLYIVCEDAERMVVTVDRHGYLDNPVSVRIKTRSKSALQDEDFVTDDDQAISFATGQTNKTWSIEIKLDGKFERNEKFRLKLRNPENAILGLNSKTIIQIVNYQDGQCPEYIGMISKNQNPLDEESVDIFGEDNSELDSTYWPPLAGGDVGDFHEVDFDAMPPFFGSDQNDPFDLEGERAEDIGGKRNQRKKKKDNRNADESDAVKHPMSKYRNKKGRKNNNRKRNKGRNGRKDKKKPENRKDDPFGLSGTEESFTGLSDVTKEGLMAPQKCTGDTQGLLYFDLMSSRMYRCNGQSWQPWGWGSGVQQYATMLHDQANDDGNGGEQAASAGVTPQVDDGEFQPARVEGEVSSGDKDTCPHGWGQYRDDCYKFFRQKENWEASEVRCKQLGGHLADVSSAKHLQWLWDLSRGRSFWIGMNDKRMRTVWEFTNGRPARYYNWRRGFPRTKRAYDTNCILVAKRQQWVNRPCDMRFSRYICSKPLKERRKRHQHEHRQRYFYEDLDEQ